MKVSTICFPVRSDQVYLANKKRGFGEGYLNGYGGKKKPSDISIEHAAVREMTEESKVKISPEKLEKVAVIDFFEAGVHLFECHIFLCRDWEGELCETKEMAAPQAFDMKNPPYERMWDADRSWLPLVFSGKKFRARSYYYEGMNRQEKFEYELI